MHKKKLKVKKRTWIVLIIIIFLVIGVYAGKKIYDDYLYKQTNEYKLLEIGYTLDEIKLLNKKTNEEVINDLLNAPKNEFLLKLIKEEYYLNNHLTRYLSYYEENKDKDASEIVRIVNTNNDYNYYEHDIDTDLEQDYLILVNKYYNLNENYVPKDLVNVSNNYYYGENHKIRKKVYEAFIDMWNAAHEENIYLIINSSFRDFKEQLAVYEDYKNTRGTSYADSVAARAGYSEHQTGLSLDIFSKDATMTTNFKDSEAYKWLTQNAHKYGFIERYQKDKEYITGYAAEAWHWRYVGVDAATYIHDHNITFDEYYAYFIEK